MRMLPFLVATAAAIATVVAQAPPDLIGITFQGQVYTFDSHTGAGGLLVNTGLVGTNAMALSGDTPVVVNRVGPAAAPTFDLQVLDPVTGALTLSRTNLGFDPRGLALRPGTIKELVAVVDGQPDVLVRYNPQTSTLTTIGPTGFTQLQSLVNHQNLLYAWDLTHGLVRLSATSGVGTDPFPAVGAQGIDLQWLLSHGDGRLLGGRQDLYEIDPATGLATLLGPIAGGGLDLRGAEERRRIGEVFGTGCLGAPGQPIALTLTPNPGPPLPLIAQSSPHAPNRPGLLLVGASATTALGQALPLLVDPLFGTQNCFLRVSPDASLLSVTDSSGRFTITLPITAALVHVSFFLQHVVLEPVPGGMSFSPGGHVRIGL
jgi:hypothetical protein